jgi:hypothetical protein
MRSKNYSSFLIGCLIALSFLMVACDKRHKPDLTNADHKADVDETVNGNIIPATQGNAGDQLSNSNSTIDLNTTTGTGTNSSTSTTNNTNTSTTTQTAAGSIVTLANGLDFFKPTNPAVVRCGSLINRYINGSHCSVNSFTGASQPLGMIMKMSNTYGTTGPACPKVCLCTGENIEMSGWNCQHLPQAQSYKVLIQGCGSRVKTFYGGTADETTCSVNEGGDINPMGTTKGMKLLVGKKSVCDQASCLCKGKVTLNRKYAGWKCTLDIEPAE